MQAAAIYARKSTEQNVSDDAKSVTRQVELARAFAEGQGWAVGPEHVYVDDGVSGALSTKLHARARMLAAAERGEFQTLVVRDLDRLSRDDREAPTLVFTLEDLGVDIWCYGDGQRVNTSTALNRGLLGMKATFAAAEREAAQTRTREAYRARVVKGLIGGGKTFGYQHVGQNGSRRLVVDEAQAHVIRRVFNLVGTGYGFLKIAGILNKEAIPGPKGQRWASTSVRNLLRRDLYRGRLVTCTTTAVYRKGRKTRIPIPRDKWVVQDVPDLRIVSDQLWKAAHARLERTKQTYTGRGKDGRLAGRAESGLVARYLLSGFVRCGLCQSSLFVGVRPRGVYLLCTSHWKTGSRPCGNKWFLNYTNATSSMLVMLRDRLLNPHVLAELLEADLLARRGGDGGLVERRAAIKADVLRLDAELERLAAAVAAGGEIPVLVTRLRDTQNRRDVAVKVLAEVEADLERGEDFDMGSWVEEAQAHLGHIQTLLENPKSNATGRAILRRLLPGPIIITPTMDEAGKLTGWEIAGEGDAASLIRGLLDRTGKLKSPAPSMEKVLERMTENLPPIVQMILEAPPVESNAAVCIG